jgi:hypothetical protein
MLAVSFVVVDKSNPAYKHGHAERKGFSPTYHSWAAMRSRCTNPNVVHWKSYGGRGIVCCVRWASFEAFLEDMGERPAGTTLERKAVNGHYEPGNCCWATWAEQRANKRRTLTDAHRQAVLGQVQAGVRRLPELVSALGLHDEVIKKEIRKLVSAGILRTTRVAGDAPRGRTLYLELI